MGREESDCFVDARGFEGVVTVGVFVLDVEGVEGGEAGEGAGRGHGSSGDCIISIVSAGARLTGLGRLASNQVLFCLILNEFPWVQMCTVRLVDYESTRVT